MVDVTLAQLCSANFDLVHPRHSLEASCRLVAVLGAVMNGLKRGRLNLLVIADGADLVSNLREESVLFEWLV